MKRRAPKAAPSTGRRRAVLYLRVSTTDQAERGVSLEAQRERLLAWAASADVEVVAIEEDAGLSAATLDRPALARALDLLRRRRADLLAVVKLDRLTRSVRDLGALVEDTFGERGAGLVSLSEAIDTTTPGGRLVLHVLGAVGEWERGAIAERTRTAMRHLAATGRYTGGVERYGFRVGEGGVLVPDPGEQDVIQRAAELRAGGASFRAIATMLADEGRVSRAGRPFEASAIKRMLDAQPARAA